MDNFQRELFNRVQLFQDYTIKLCCEFMNHCAVEKFFEKTN